MNELVGKWKLDSHAGEGAHETRFLAAMRLRSFGALLAPQDDNSS
jgi:hypothetical protein